VNATTSRPTTRRARSERRRPWHLGPGRRDLPHRDARDRRAALGLHL